MLAATTLWGSEGPCRLRNRAAVSSFLNGLFASLLAILIALLPWEASFAQINYGSFIGTTVDFIDVTEQSTTADTLPLFGPPVLSANSLDFNPVGFDAGASGAGGMDNTGGRLTYRIQAHAGQAIPIITFSESGDTTLAGAGTDSTSSQVTANGTVTINAVDGAAITPIVRPISLTFTPSGGDYALTSDGGGLPIFHTSWSGSLTLNVAQILTTESVPFTLGATNVSIDLVNTLAAHSEAGTESLIGKKDFGVTVVPEPGALMLFAFALIPMIGLTAFRRCPR